MTVDEVRDRIAALLGWTKNYDDIAGGECWYSPSGDHRDLTRYFHPVPADLDGIAALWPENWEWDRGMGFSKCWRAFRKEGQRFFNMRIVDDTGDEKHDRLSLLLAVLEYEAEQKS